MSSTISKHMSAILVVVIIAIIVIGGVIYIMTSQPASITPTLSPSPSLTPTQSPTLTSTPVEKRKLYVSHWGFGWDLIYKLVVKPFEEKYNVEIVLISGTTAERFAKLSSRAEPIPDIIFLPDYYTYRAMKLGLLMKLDLTKLSNYNDIISFVREQLPDYIKEYGVPHTIQDMALAYRSDRVPSITSWKDIWNVTGDVHILWPYITATSGPMAAALTSLAYTGNLTDIDVALAHIEELKPRIVAFYTRSGDPQLFFERGEADIAPILRYNWGPLYNLSLPIKIVCPVEGSIYILNLVSIVNGSKNIDLAYEFINYWISEEAQKKLAEALVDAPINAKVELPPGHPFDISCVFSKPIYLEPKILGEDLERWTNLWKERIG